MNPTQKTRLEAKIYFQALDFSNAKLKYEELLDQGLSNENDVIMLIRSCLKIGSAELAYSYICSWEKANITSISAKFRYEKWRVFRNLNLNEELRAEYQLLPSLDLRDKDLSDFRSFVEKHPIPTKILPPPEASEQFKAFEKIISNETSILQNVDSLIDIFSFSDFQNYQAKVFTVLLKNQQYESVDLLYNFLSTKYLLDKSLERAARVAMFAAKPISAFSILSRHGFNFETTSNENIRLVSDIISQLNLWSLSSRLEKVRELLPVYETYRDQIERFLLDVPIDSDENEKDFLECSRLVFGALIEYLNNEKIETKKSDISNVCIVSMHGGFGGAPGKAMRFASAMPKRFANVSILFEASRPIENTELIKTLHYSGVKIINSQRTELSLFNEIENQHNEIGQMYLDLLKIIRPKYKFASIARLAVCLKEEKPDIVHAIGTLDLQISTYIAAKLAGVQRIVLNPGMMRSCIYANTETQYLESQYHKHVLSVILQTDNTVVLCNNSQAATNDFDMWLGLVSGTTKLLKNGVSIPKLQQIGIDTYKKKVAGKKVIAVIGRIAVEKNPFLILEAFSDVIKKIPDALIVFAGSGPLKADAEQIANKTLPKNSFIFFGDIQDVPELLKNCDLVLLISDGEGLPNTLIEAQILGVPVVANCAGGATETFINGSTGLVVEKSRGGIADGIEKVLIDKSFKVNCEQYLQSYTAEYSIDRMVADAVDLYEKI